MILSCHVVPLRTIHMYHDVWDLVSDVILEIISYAVRLSLYKNIRFLDIPLDRSK